jgi:hypothetical protein
MLYEHHVETQQWLRYWAVISLSAFEEEVAVELVVGWGIGRLLDGIKEKSMWMCCLKEQKSFAVSSEYTFDVESYFF